MQLSLTVAQLEAKEACEEGVEAFRAAFGDEAKVEWTREKQIETLRSPLGKWLAWAWRVDLIPWWSMSWADLSRANLSGADLSWADRPNLDSAKVCLCESSPCVALRKLLDDNGWSVSYDGLLRQKEAVAATA